MNARNRGFSMVELMVAMVIGLMILAAVSSVLVNSKKNYTTQDSLARLQENARFTVQILTRDLRMAGYFGCADDISTVSNRLNPTATNFSVFDTNNPIEGSESGANWSPSNTALGFTPLAGTDAIAIRYLAGDSIAVTKEMPRPSAAVQVDKNSGLANGDIIMIADCTSADVFQITNLNTNSGTFDLVNHNWGTGSPGNAGNDTSDPGAKLSKAYGTDAQIMRFNSVAYYVRNNASGQPALYRRTLVTNATAGTSTPTEQELVEGVEHLEILYGIDSVGNDGTPDVYKTAAAVAGDWSKVIAVRFGIVARALANADNQAGNDKQYGTDRYTTGLDVDGVLPGTEFTPPAGTDRYQRRVFRTTVVMRNLQ